MNSRLKRGFDFLACEMSVLDHHTISKRIINHTLDFSLLELINKELWPEQIHREAAKAESKDLHRLPEADQDIHDFSSNEKLIEE
jgi:hypothetical protein